MVVDYYYHIFNRSINKEPIFTRKRDCARAAKCLGYYRYSNPPMKLSHFLDYGVEKRKELLNQLRKSKKLVEIAAYCLMPNHFHLLLKQVTDEGISKFLSKFQNSYTKFMNTKYKREGHLFKGQFRSVLVEDDEQLLHLSRYIHLNPYSSAVVPSFKALESYPFSSFPEYLGDVEDGMCDKDIILGQFRNTLSYKKFVFDNAEYQKSLAQVKHLALE